MASARRRMARRSPVTSPTMRIAKPGPGNGWRATIPRQAEFAADAPRPEQQTQRFDKGEFEVVRRPPTLWWLLMLAAAAAAGSDDVRIQGPLDEEVDLLPAAARSPSTSVTAPSKEPDELASDDLVWPRIADAGQPLRTRLGGIDRHQACTGGGDEVLLHLFALTLTKQTVIDEHAGQPVTDGALASQRRQPPPNPRRRTGRR